MRAWLFQICIEIANGNAGTQRFQELIKRVGFPLDIQPKTAFTLAIKKLLHLNLKNQRGAS